MLILVGLSGAVPGLVLPDPSAGPEIGTKGRLVFLVFFNLPYDKRYIT